MVPNAAGSRGNGIAPVVRSPINLSEARRPHGRVFIIPSRCKGCTYCIELCPEDVLVASPEMNAKGYHYPVVAEGKEEACVACEFCSLVCPDFAIYTEEAKVTA